MKLYVLFVLLLIGFSHSKAQNPNLPAGKHFFVVPPNEYWYKQPWRDSTYAFPEFQPGKLELSNGFVPSLRPMLNYDIFLQRFVIRQDNGDVVGLDYSSEIKYVWVGDHKFVFSRSFGYLEVILEGKASIAESTFMHVIFELSSGAKYPSTVSDNRTGISKSIRYYWPDKAYYIFSDPSHIHRTSPAVLPKIFTNQKSKIRSFEKEHRTNYKKKQDLIEIVSYCNREL